MTSQPVSLVAALSRRAAFLAGALLTGALACSTGYAQTTGDGDVFVYDGINLYAEDPFSDFLEGVHGHSVEDEIPFGESPTSYVQFFYERGQDVMIGRSSAGIVRVSGGDDLRYEHLILGGREDDFNGNDVITSGTLLGPSTGNGVMRLEQLGTSFNNHPQIVPAQYQDFLNPENTLFPTPGNFNVNIDYDGDGNTDRVVPVDGTRDTTAGFDAVIGLTGTGKLFLNTGARMEIEDAFIVGYGPEASGYVEVDGVGTYLGVYGGLSPNAVTPTRAGYASATDSIHQMIIGAYGYGDLRITGGASVDAFYGAAIGVTQSDGDDDITDSLDNTYELNGIGAVVVDGPGSTWNISSSVFSGDMPPSGFSSDGAALAIGEFDDAGIYTDEQLGVGSLSISNSAVVRTRRYTDGTSASDEAAVVRVGLNGTLGFFGGRMIVQDAFINDGVVQADLDSLDSAISLAGGGGGRLDVATFENRADGRVRVRQGQTLEVSMHARIGELSGGTFNAANFGLIEVVGDDANGISTISFDREFEGDVETLTPFTSLVPRDGNYMELFYNAPGGQIVAQRGIVRARTGIWNEGDMQFTAGDNIVEGRVMNAPTGAISIVNGAHVAFLDSVTNDGSITISGGGSASVLGEGPHTGGGTALVAYHGVGALNLLTTGDFHAAGNFALGDDFTPGGASGTGGSLLIGVGDLGTGDFAHLIIEGEGDFGFGTPATIGFVSLGPSSGSIAPGDEFTFVTAAGGLSGAGTIALSSLPLSPTPGVALIPISNAFSFGLLAVADLSIGADFNGDGVVDLADLAIWNTFHGVEAGALGANGDVDLDGDVDSTDFAYIIDQLGGPGVAVAMTAPEPGSLALLASLGLLGMRRRRV